MKKLSIITVCKNEADSIEKTILSVINQSFRDFEYIIIDGGSTDDTLKVIQKYRDKIDILISEPDTGIYNAQNKGINHSNGEYLFFLNAGDYFVNNRVLEEIFSFEPQTEIVFGDIFVILSEKIAFKKKLPYKLSKSYLFNDTLPHQASIIKRTLFDKVGLYDENLEHASDYKFFLNSIYKYNTSISHLPVSFSFYNLKGKSSGLKSRKSLNAERKQCQIECFNKIQFYFFHFIKPFYQLFIKYPRFALQIIFNRIKIQ